MRTVAWFTSAILLLALVGMAFALPPNTGSPISPALATATGLSVGQIVQLTAGGPWLTIVKPEAGTPPMATATWYEWNDGEFKTVGPLPQNCFRPVPPEAQVMPTNPLPEVIKP